MPIELSFSTVDLQFAAEIHIMMIILIKTLTLFRSGVFQLRKPLFLRKPPPFSSGSGKGEGFLINCPPQAKIFWRVFVFLQDFVSVLSVKIVGKRVLERRRRNFFRLRR